MTKLDEEKIKDLIIFYENHSSKDTAKKYKISLARLFKILKNNNIQEHTTKENTELSSLYKYGTKHPTQAKTVKDKTKCTNIKKYGVENPFQCRELVDNGYIKNSGSIENHYKKVSEKMTKTNLEKYGNSCSAHGKEIEIKIKQTNLEKYGTEYYFASDDAKEKINLVRNQTIEKTKQTNLKKYGVESYAQTKEFHQKAGLNRFKKSVASDGKKFDSMWEVIIHEYFKNQNIPIEYQIPLKYEYKGKNHISLIDFKIGDYLIECKGDHLLKDCFKQSVPIDAKLKLYEDNNVIVVCSIENIFNEIANSYNLKGININLFINNSYSWEQLKNKINNYTNFINN